MNVDKIVQTSRDTCRDICRGARTEMRSAIVPQPGPSDSPGGCGFSWYHDPRERSHYVWGDTLPELLEAMVGLGYSPFGLDGGSLGIVVQPTQWNADHADDPAVPAPIACKARVIRSWVHRLDEMDLDSCRRTGVPPMSSVMNYGPALTPELELKWSREWVVRAAQRFFGAAIVRPESYIWAVHFEVTEVLKP